MRVIKYINSEKKKKKLLKCLIIQYGRTIFKPNPSHDGRGGPMNSSLEGNYADFFYFFLFWGPHEKCMYFSKYMIIFFVFEDSGGLYVKDYRSF